MIPLTLLLIGLSNSGNSDITGSNWCGAATANTLFIHSAGVDDPTHMNINSPFSNKKTPSCLSFSNDDRTAGGISVA